MNNLIAKMSEAIITAKSFDFNADLRGLPDDRKCQQTSKSDEISIVERNSTASARTFSRAQSISKVKSYENQRNSNKPTNVEV
jgi:hypothetical protein